jgi:hypothetical protein
LNTWFVGFATTFTFLCPQHITGSISGQNTAGTLSTTGSTKGDVGTGKHSDDEGGLGIGIIILIGEQAFAATTLPDVVLQLFCAALWA